MNYRLMHMAAVMYHTQPIPTASDERLEIEDARLVRKQRVAAPAPGLQPPQTEHTNSSCQVSAGA